MGLSTAMGNPCPVEERCRIDGVFAFYFVSTRYIQFENYKKLLMTLIITCKSAGFLL